MNAKKCKQLRKLARSVAGGQNNTLPHTFYTVIARKVQRYIDKIDPDTGEVKRVKAQFEKAQTILHESCEKAIYRRLKKIAKRAGF